MSERVLHEFSQRITRAKTLLDNTKSQNTALKKEALKLEREDSLPFFFSYLFIGIWGSSKCQKERWTYGGKPQKSISCHKECQWSRYREESWESFFE